MIIGVGCYTSKYVSWGVQRVVQIESVGMVRFSCCLNKNHIVTPKRQIKG